MNKSIAVAAGLLALVVATPAGAHEEISPASVPFGKPAYLILSAANEKRVDLNRVSIAAPSGGEFGHATRDPAGWTVSLTHTAVTWSGGAVRPGRFEQFGFDIEGFRQPGTFTYRVTLGYSDGSSNEVEVAVTAAPEGGSTATATVAPTTVAAPPQPAVTGGEDESSDGLATVALGVGIVALVVAVVAVLQARKMGHPPAERRATAAASAGQDW
jgi:hypothetical protein